MLNTWEKSTGTEYTTPVALLSVALLFVPLVMFVSSPFGNGFGFLAACTSLLCLVLSWTAWKRTSALTIPSIAVASRQARRLR